MKKKVIYLSLLVVALGIIIIPINIKIKKANVYESMVVVPDIDSYKILTLEDIATNQINENVEKKKTTYEFYATMFGIDYDTLITEIRNNNKTAFNELDLLQTGNNKASFDASLLEFMTNLESRKSELFKRDYTYKNCSKEYIMTVKIALRIILLESIVAIAISVVAFFLLEYLSHQLNWEFNAVAAVYFLVMFPFALLLGWLAKKLVGKELSEKQLD